MELVVFVFIIFKIVNRISLCMCHLIHVTFILWACSHSETIICVVSKKRYSNISIKYMVQMTKTCHWWLFKNNNRKTWKEIKWQIVDGCFFCIKASNTTHSYKMQKRKDRRTEIAAAKFITVKAFVRFRIIKDKVKGFIYDELGDWLYRRCIPIHIYEVLFKAAAPETHTYINPDYASRYFRPGSPGAPVLHYADHPGSRAAASKVEWSVCAANVGLRKPSRFLIARSYSCFYSLQYSRYTSSSACCAVGKEWWRDRN